MSAQRPYYIAADKWEPRSVEAWAGYPLQFDGQRRFTWQDDMVAELKAGLASTRLAPAESLCGTYLTTQDTKCDAENRLFTNPGASTFPGGITSLRFERGLGPMPDPPVPIERSAGHLHYYRYVPAQGFTSWKSDHVFARWHRAARTLPADGSCRPAWLALKRAASAGSVEVFTPRLGDKSLFGIRITIHATRRGPRSAPAVSEQFVDGAIAAFHAAEPHPQRVATALALRMPGVSAIEIANLAALDWPGACFADSPFTVGAAGYVQISPCDERCVAGEVTIVPDASDRFAETSGELFYVRPLDV